MAILLYVVAGLVAVGSLNILFRMPRSIHNHPIEDYLVWSTHLIGACVAILLARWWPLGVAFLVALAFTALKVVRVNLRQTRD